MKNILKMVLLVSVAAKQQFAIQIDAGSSGSRLFIYEYDKRVFNTLPPSLTQIKSKLKWGTKIKKSLDNFPNHFAAAESIQTLLKFAQNYVNPSETYVFLGATAGMRKIAPAKAVAILDEICVVIRRMGFKDDNNCRDRVQILSGEEEGVFGWITVNSLQQTLQTQTQTVVELGGASSQFTTVPSEPIRDHAFPVQLAEIYHKVYTRSDLYFGIDEARKKFRDRLESDINPCYPIDSTDSDRFNGASNWTQCLKSAQNIIHFESQIPSINSTIGLIGIFHHIWNFVKLEKFHTSLPTLLAEGQTFCTQNKTSQEKYKIAGDKWSPHDYCFGIAYIAALLNAYGIKQQNFNVYETLQDQGQRVDVQWTYGAMLYQINHSPWFYEKEGFELSTIILSIVVCILIAVIVGIYFKWNKSYHLPPATFEEQMQLVHKQKFETISNLIF